MLQVGKGSSSAERSGAERAPAVLKNLNRLLSSSVFGISYWCSAEERGRASLRSAPLDPFLTCEGDGTRLIESGVNGSDSRAGARFASLCSA